MESITLGQIATGVALLAGLIGGIALLGKTIKGWLDGMFKEQMKGISKEISGISECVDDMKMQQCKNFIVACIADIEHGQPLTEIQMQRFCEQYDYYVKHDGNGYIKGKVKHLQENGKL